MPLVGFEAMPAQGFLIVFGIGTTVMNSGGEGGIRTLGCRMTSPDFESGTFNRSATSPQKRGIVPNPLPGVEDFWRAGSDNGQGISPHIHQACSRQAPAIERQLSQSQCHGGELAPEALDRGPLIPWTEEATREFYRVLQRKIAPP